MVTSAKPPRAPLIVSCEIETRFWTLTWIYLGVPLIVSCEIETQAEPEGAPLGYPLIVSCEIETRTRAFILNVTSTFNRVL